MVAIESETYLHMIRSTVPNLPAFKRSVLVSSLFGEPYSVKLNYMQANREPTGDCGLQNLESLKQPVRGETDEVSVQDGHIVGEEKSPYNNQQNTRDDMNGLDIPTKYL